MVLGPPLCPFTEFCSRSDLLSDSAWCLLRRWYLQHIYQIVRNPSPLPVWWNENPQLPVDDASRLWEEAPRPVGSSSSDCCSCYTAPSPEPNRTLDMSRSHSGSSNALCVPCGTAVGPLDFQVTCRAGHVRHTRCVVEAQPSTTDALPCSTLSSVGVALAFPQH